MKKGDFMYKHISNSQYTQIYTTFKHSIYTKYTRIVCKSKALYTITKKIKCALHKTYLVTKIYYITDQFLLINQKHSTCIVKWCENSEQNYIIRKLVKVFTGLKVLVDQIPMIYI